MAEFEKSNKCCFVTLITRPSYLPGVVVLAHTLDKQASKYPLVVQYTATLGAAAIAALTEEGLRHGRILPILIEPLLPRPGQENIGAIAERFGDTFSKLRAFELYKFGYTRVCFVDADMAAYNNPDGLFNDCQHLPRDWLAATHNCVCSQDVPDDAPSDWHKGNCAYTPLTSGSQINTDTSSRPTYRLLNGGLFCFCPSEELWQRMNKSFNDSERLRYYRFPDQDFLADFFRNRWTALSWKYNAMKTNLYYHPNLWSGLIMLHYIIDKPWERLVSQDGIAGVFGRDGEAHGRWWKLFAEWKTTQPPRSKTLAVTERWCAIKDPFTKIVPVPEEPGKPSDVKPYVSQ